MGCNKLSFEETILNIESHNVLTGEGRSFNEINLVPIYQSKVQWRFNDLPRVSISRTAKKKPRSPPSLSSRLVLVLSPFSPSAKPCVNWFLLFNFLNYVTFYSKLLVLYIHKTQRQHLLYLLPPNSECFHLIAYFCTLWGFCFISVLPQLSRKGCLRLLKALMFSMKRPSEWPCLSPMEMRITTSNTPLKCYPFGISIQKRLHSVIRSAVVFS